ncbi:MAG: hypothetical protein PHV93_04680 [Candidatus Pacebacteria bacterium]|nr:hypothetical protein [Candidatus Paceibacterota bacterium]
MKTALEDFGKTDKTAKMYLKGYRAGRQEAFREVLKALKERRFWNDNALSDWIVIQLKGLEEKAGVK